MPYKKKTWIEKDREAWEKAASELEAKGYERIADAWTDAFFRKHGTPDLRLVRSLGKLDWRPVAS